MVSKTKSAFRWTIIGLIMILACSVSFPAMAAKEHVKILDRLLGAMTRYYWDTDYRGLDWKTLTDETRAKVEAAPDLEKSMAEIAKLLDKLKDHHTRLEPPGANDTEATETYGGIGCMLQLKKDEGYLLITEVFDGSPAKESGIVPGDRIWTIDKIPVSDFVKDNKDPTNAIRGKIDTTVTLSVERNGGRKEDINIARRQIVYEKKPSYRKIGDFGYLEWSNFYAGVSKQVGKILDDAAKDTTGLILDMRSNPGGYINELKDIAAYLDMNDLGKAVSREGTTRYRNSWRKPKYTKPIVILVDSGTASAAEILSTVAKESGRAVLVGQPTSNGTAVAISYDLGEGYMASITVAQFFTPQGHPYNAPTNPEIYMSDYTEDDFRAGRDRWLDAAVEVLKGITGGDMNELKQAS